MIHWEVSPLAHLHIPHPETSMPGGVVVILDEKVRMKVCLMIAEEKGLRLPHDTRECLNHCWNNLLLNFFLLIHKSKIKAIII